MKNQRHNKNSVSVIGKTDILYNFNLDELVEIVGPNQSLDVLENIADCMARSVDVNTLGGLQYNDYGQVKIIPTNFFNFNIMLDIIVHNMLEEKVEIPVINTIKDLVSEWTRDEMHSVQAHFAIKSALNRIRADLLDPSFEHKPWSVTGFTTFVIDRYGMLLSSIFGDGFGDGLDDEITSIIIDCYYLELSDINNHTLLSNNKEQNWAYLTKVTN